MSSSALLAISLIGAFVVGTIILNIRFRRQMRVLCAQRSGQSICQFARSLPFRQLDTRVIRQVYETLQATVSFPGCRVPIRTDDRITDTFGLEDEDFEDFIVEIADRCGRSLANFQSNPFYERLHTAGDIVHFLCAQPRVI
jgi:hypothetical protein